MNKKLLLGLGAVIVVVIIIVMVSRGSNSSTTTTDQPAEATAVDTASPAPVNTTSSLVKMLAVSGKNFSFTPSTLTVKKGDAVTITFTNTDGFHDLKIDQFNVATKRIGEGQSEEVSFIADTAGSFEYYCSVGNHRAMGMKGTLTVTE